MKALARLCVLCKNDHGAALVELAFVIPILLLLVIGAVDFGRAYYMGIEVTNAAHAGAEYGSLNPPITSTAGIIAAAKQSASDLSSMSVTVPSWGCECSDGSSSSASCATTPSCTVTSTRGGNAVYWVKVNTSVTYTTLMPWPGISNSFALSGTATVRGNK
jgi:Flp pilus assembly protein TadG